MPLIPKPNYNQIFASQAPDQDKPAVFNNYPLGWGPESRPNNGKPTIKGFNYIQQTSDLKDLWVLQNGACLPYDESIEYAEGAPVLKDGVIQYKTADGFKSRDAVTIPTYNSAADGVDPVTGVSDGAYFNVRSPSGDSYIDEYQNIGGVPTPTGKSYPSSAALTGMSEAVEKLQRENVSVWDFFTPSEYESYLASPATFDSYRPLKEFFDYISANDTGTAYCSGSFYISKALVVGGASGTLTKLVVGDVLITAINDISTPIVDLVTFWTGQNFIWSGVFEVAGNTINSLEYSRRKVLNGIRIGGAYSSTHCKFSAIIAMNGFKNYGVILDNLTTGTQIDKIRVNRSGSGYLALDGQGNPTTYICYESSQFTLSSTIEGSGNQRSIVSVSNLIDFSVIEGSVYAYIDGALYWVVVNETDLINKTISLFPKLPDSTTTGKLNYVYGGGFLTKGGDASVTKISAINVSTSAISLCLHALYPPVMDAVTTQENFMALSLGASLSAGFVGGLIGEQYYEANTFDIVQNTKFEINFKINNTVALDLKKCLAMSNYRAGTGLIADAYFLTISVGLFNKPLNYFESTGGSTYSYDITKLFGGDSLKIYGATNKVLNLQMSDLRPFDLFRDSKRTVYFLRTSTVASPTITVNPPAGVNMNGSTSPLIITGYVGIIQLDILIHDATNIVVRVLGSRSTGRSTYAPPSLAAGERSAIQTMTLNGANLGDNINISFNRSLEGVSLYGYVSAVNTVSYYFENRTAETVSLASGTVKAEFV